MPDRINAPEERKNLIPLRKAYFSPGFWAFWERLRDRHQAAYVLGWIAELEQAIRGLTERLRRIEEHLEDDGK